MNVAIFTKDFNWTGGIDFLHGIVKGLLTQQKKKISIYVLIHDSTILEKKPVKAKVKSGIKSLFRLLTNPNKNLFLPKQKQHGAGLNDGFIMSPYIIEIFSEENVSLVYYNDGHFQAREKVLSSVSADIVLPFLSVYFPKSAKVPWVGYLFDFVYKYYPHLYTSTFCLETDIAYASILLHSKAVVVNSKDVYNDIQGFFPYQETRIFVLPFAPFTNINTYQKALNNEDVKRSFGIDRKYFIISNQFWLHKSHETAFEALAQLHQVFGEKDICLVCTGKMTDLSGTNSRKEELEKFVLRLGLENSIFFLGHLSKADQLALMIRSEGLLQPTTFEGGPGGGSVYMAIANGVPAIVSDIPVNKEIENEPLVTFFKVRDPADLATKMYEQLVKGFSLLPGLELEEKNKKRLNALGDTLVDCIDFVTTN